MARASTRAWVGIIAGVALGGATASAASLGLAGLSVSVAQTPPRQARASSALTNGIDCYRRGDYENAARFLGDAQAGQDYLTADGRKELADYLALNNKAIQARGTGAKQLREAEEAAKAGRNQDAEFLLKSVTSNQFLSAADKQKAQQLLERVRPNTGTTSTSPSANVPPIVLARAKLQQARSLLAKADFIRAEALAKEAVELKAMYNQGEDTPTKLLTDINKVRTDPKWLTARAREALKRGEIDRAEELAHQAERASGAWTYRPWDDKPSKVIRDAQQARRMQNKLPVAQTPTAATPAPVAPKEENTGRLDSLKNMFKGPSAPAPNGPVKVQGDGNQSRNPAATAPLADAKSAPAASGIQQTAAVSKTVATTPVAATGQQAPAENAGQAARKLLKQARQSLQAGNLAQARQQVAQAKTYKVDYSWWEDNPDKVMDDILRAAPRLSDTPAAGANKAPAAGATVSAKKDAAPAKSDAAAPQKPAAAKPAVAKEDPYDLLKRAREQYNAKNLDEAEKTACRVKTSRPNGWGLFEDSPDKLLQDIRKAKAKQNREESVQLVIDARKLYEQGKYTEARAKAYRAEVLHGPYSVWDLGDRPQKLIAEIDSAEAKNHRVKVPPVPVPLEKPALASRTDTGTKPAAPVAPEPKIMTAGLTGHPGKETSAAPSWPKESSTTAPGDNPYPRTTSGESPYARSTNAGTAPSPSAPAPMPNLGTPMAKAPQPSAPVAAMPLPVPPAPVPPPVVVSAQPAPAVAANKVLALNLLAESRQLQAQGKLVEARQKALEAQRTGATFNADEERPERVLIHLAGLANARINTLRQQAADAAATAGGNVAQYNRAEEALSQARQLAAGFALDTQPIDGTVAWVRQVRDRAMAAATPAPAPPQAPVPVIMPAAHRDVVAVNPAQRQGLELLEKARLELRNGNAVNARRLGEEAYKGPYAVQPQAEALLRSVDAEEFNQRRLVANRTYEAGNSAFQRRDYAQAAAVLRTVDLTMLEQDKQARYRELMRTPEMQKLMPVSAQVPMAPPGAPEAPGRALASDQPQLRPLSPEQSFSQQVSAMQEVQFQKLRNDGLQAQRTAVERYRAGDPERAIEVLREHLDSLNNTNLEPGRLALLKRPIESRLEQFKSLKMRDELERLQASNHETFESMQQKRQLAEQMKQEKVAELMKQYKTLYKEGKYQDAEMVAMRAHELDPDNVAADAAVHVARLSNNVHTAEKLKSERETMVLEGLNGAETEGPYVGGDDPMKINKEAWEKRVMQRKDVRNGFEIMTTKSAATREIERSLNNPISVDFKDMPLRDVISELHALSGVNVVPEMNALEADGISLNQPLTMKLEGVSLKSALNLLLSQAHLTYVIQDEVLKVTTPTHARGKLVQKTYSVPDLVIPIDALNQEQLKFPDVINKLNRQQNAMSTAVSPYTGMNSLPNAQPTGNAAGIQNAQSMTSTQAGATSGPNALKSNGRTGGQTMEDVLIATIKNTIDPKSWSDMGGPGTIDYFPLGMALVINQTPDIQEQVAELLSALRRLQDIEVTIEVRFITLSEEFYERIGVDFNLNVVNRETSKYEPQIVSGQFAPPGFVNRFVPPSFVTGITPAGTAPSNGTSAFTHDLNIPISFSSFPPAFPLFGAPAIAPGADGGMSLGLAFLSDVQVFMFLEAAQGDRRTNIMQAPKLTMFNGQSATINITDFEFFVTGNVIGLFNGQVVVSPQNQPFPIGVLLTMLPTVTADRRFVRISMAPSLTNVNAALTNLFPISTVVIPTFDTGVVGQPVPIVQFLQQPTFTTISVNTTVTVPDGGTVLMGGLKTMKEGRNEFGPPILSKIPYLSRLVKNTSYGRETSSMMIMVTPRIIINEEEETRQTGYVAPPAGAGF